jgi:hypothetical protein
MWYEFNSEAEFNSWHDALCQTLGYPLTAINQATGELDEAAEKTTAYTQAFTVQDKWIAFIDTEYATNLTATDLRLERPAI